MVLKQDSWHYKIYSFFASDPPKTFCTYLWSWFSIVVLNSAAVLAINIGLIHLFDDGQHNSNTILFSGAVATLFSFFYLISKFNTVMRNRGVDVEKFYVYITLSIPCLYLYFLGSSFVGGIAAMILPEIVINTIYQALNVSTESTEKLSLGMFCWSILGTAVIIPTYVSIKIIQKVYDWSNNECAPLEIQ